MSASEIYIIMDDDPLGGDADSIDNRPHLQLLEMIKGVATGVSTTVTPICPTEAPVLTVSVSGRSVILRWSKPEILYAAMLEYELQISETAIGWSSLGPMDGASTSWEGILGAVTSVGNAFVHSLTSLPLGGTTESPTARTYYFRVRARWGDDVSPWSDAVEVEVGPWGAGDLADQAVSRAKLSAEFVEGIETMSSQIAGKVNAKIFNATTGLWEIATEAFMALRVSLPSVMSSERKDSVEALLTVAEFETFAAVYESFTATWYDSGVETTGTRYRIKASALQADIDDLTDAFQRVGMLSTQFLVDAEEVFLTGTIRGRHLEMDTISAEIFSAVRAKIVAAEIEKLTAAEIDASTLTIESSNLGTTIVEGGHIKTDLIDVGAIRATAGFFDNITVSGKASFSEIVMNGITAGENHVKDAMSMVGLPLISNGALTILEKQICASGVVKFSIELRSDGSNPAFANVYVNGIFHSEYQRTGSFEVKTGTINVSAGDVILVKGYRTGTSDVTYARNCYLGISEQPGLLKWIGNPA